MPCVFKPHYISLVLDRVVTWVTLCFPRVALHGGYNTRLVLQTKTQRVCELRRSVLEQPGGLVLSGEDVCLYTASGLKIFTLLFEVTNTLLSVSEWQEPLILLN